MTDPFVLYLAAGVAATILVIVFALLGAEKAPIVKADDAAIRKAQLDLIARSEKKIPLARIGPLRPVDREDPASATSVIPTRARNGRPR